MDIRKNFILSEELHVEDDLKNIFNHVPTTCMV